MRDIYHSARGHFKECKYWIRDERDSVGDLTKWILENKPAGMFLAMEINEKSDRANQLSNSFMWDVNSVTLETNDLVDDLVRGCVVLYLNHAWLVNGVQRMIHRQESEFAEERYTTYISLTR